MTDKKENPAITVLKDTYVVASDAVRGGADSVSFGLANKLDGVTNAMLDPKTYTSLKAAGENIHKYIGIQDQMSADANARGPAYEEGAIGVPVLTMLAGLGLALAPLKAATIAETVGPVITKMGRPIYLVAAGAYYHENAVIESEHHKPRATPNVKPAASKTPSP